MARYLLEREAKSQLRECRLSAIRLTGFFDGESRRRSPAEALKAKDLFGSNRASLPSRPRQRVMAAVHEEHNQEKEHRNAQPEMSGVAEIRHHENPGDQSRDTNQHQITGIFSHIRSELGCAN